MEIPDFRPVHNWRNHINQNGRYKIHPNTYWKKLSLPRRKAASKSDGRRMEWERECLG